MPVQPTYPGVYIEEIPSGVRTITGVATSITAFIGSALRGPDNEPVTINSFGDFERLFGGMWVKSTLGYAVKDFYQNGGSQAIIVRLVNGGVAATLNLLAGSPNNLLLEAASKGTWGNTLKASVNHKTKDEANSDLFNLTVFEDREGGLRESFLNVSINEDDSRYLPRVLKQSSMLVRVPGAMPPVRPLEVSSSPVATGGSDGGDLSDSDYLTDEDDKTGLFALKKTDLFNLLCIPPRVRGEDTSPEVYVAAMKLCYDERAMLLVDAPLAWGESAATAAANAIAGLGDLNLTGPFARNAALYFPLVQEADPLRDGQTETFVPSGIVAGIMARTDTTRGVWKAPAGIDAALSGVRALQVNLTDAENGQLNPLGINCLRSFPVTGRVVWGARTLRGADQLADEWKYIPVRRTALFIEESLYRGTQWVVFEPNDEGLWAQIRLNVGAFMHNLFRQGAFQGRTPKEAYLVKCDKETTTQNDINQGIVNILVGFAPLKPAEFVIIRIQQIAGQIDT